MRRRSVATQKRVSSFAIGAVIVFAATACSTARPTEHATFQSALLNVLTYAHDEIGHEFRGTTATDYDIRVVTPDLIGRYVNISDGGFTGETLRLIEATIADNTGRALVVASLRARGSATPSTNVVFLPVLRGSLPGFPDANAVVLSNKPTAGCSFRSFGQYGSQQWCAYCAVGFCCGTCRCRQCGGDITSATQGLDLPPDILSLFTGPGDLASYKIDDNLIAR